MLGAWALAQHPVLLPPGLTAGAAAAPAQVLVPMLTVLAGGALLLVPSLTWMYWLFQRNRSRQRAAGTDSRSGRPAAATRGKQP